MSYFLVMLYGDEEEYRFENQDQAEEFISQSPDGGEWVEILSLESLNTDLI
jgi:hypothetical protein